jgi:endo-1,4-beta-xylanase
MYGLKKSVAAIAVVAVAVVGVLPAVGQSVDPCTQSTALSSPSKTITSNGMGDLSGSGTTKIHYEMWTDGGQTGNNKLSWYGADKGGGAAFKAEWANPNDYLGRVGFYWGNGSAYTTYKNIYVDFNYKGKKSGNGGNYSYIGIYGWARNPSASNNDRKLIEYYIIDDWFGSGQLGTNTTGGSKVGEYTLDGGTYHVITNIRQNKPSIDGDKTFTQYFSIRQGMGANARQCGTYSVTEHFKKWEALNLILGNMYECKFLVEAGGGTGSVDLTYLKFSQENEPRGSVPAGNYTLTVSAEPPSGGTVTKNPNSSSYAPNASVTVTATPKDKNWSFDGWSGSGVTGNTNPLTVTMNADKTISAKFKLVGEDTTNLVSDGKFAGSSLSSNWSWNTGEHYGDSKGSNSVSGGKVTLNITTPGEKTYQPQLIQQGITLDKGTKYRLTFTAKAGAARSLDVGLQQSNDPWSSYTEKTFALTAAEENYKLEFQMDSTSDINVQLSFNVGGPGTAGTSVTISNVKLVRVSDFGESPPLGISNTRRQATAALPTLRATPTSSGVKVSFKASESGAATLRLYSLKGDVMSTVNLQTVSGKSYTHTLRSNGKLPSGLYMVGLQHNGGAVERMAVLVQ